MKAELSSYYRPVEVKAIFPVSDGTTMTFSFFEPNNAQRAALNEIVRRWNAAEPTQYGVLSMKPTPGPYFINGPHHLQAPGQPGDIRPRIIAQFVPGPNREADELEIVRRCNAFDELLTTIELLLVDINPSAQTKAKAVLAKYEVPSTES